MNSSTTGLDLSQCDTSIRPQDDLFGFVNGLWLRDHEIPSDKSSDSEFTRLHDLSEGRVREIITDLADSGDGPTSDSGKIGALYRLFMDEEQANQIGAQPLESRLRVIAQLGSLDDVTRFTGTAEAPVGVIALGVWNDADDPTEYRAQIFQSGLGLPDESFYREDQYEALRSAYVDYLEKLAGLADLPGRVGLIDGTARDLATAVMEFETAVARAHVDVVRLRDREKSHNPMDRQQRAAAFPGFNWDAYFEGAGAKDSWVDVINVGQPEFTQAVSEVWSGTDLATLRTWLALHTVNAASPYLSDEFVSAHFAFHGTTLSGTPELRPRWKRAVALVQSALGEAIGREYVSRHFPPEAKDRMEHLVNALIEAYRESITDLEWMTPETREKALVKLDKFTPKIGYPVKWRDYSKLEINESSLLDTVGAIARHDHEYTLGKLDGPVDPDEWHMTPQTVNAYYNPGANEIVFPAAILQPPYFGLEADDAVNFGGIGAVIGHEIGHGFDDQGSKFDGDGALKSWWTDKDRTEFERRTRSLIDDYEAMSPRSLGDEHHVNGAFTIGENIGDLGGLTIALKAYLNEAGEAAYEEKDGYSGIQRLFLAWGIVWRGKHREAEAIRRLATDPHAPAEFRANGVPRHIDTFHEAFGVREGDGMYLEPNKRVTIW